MAMAATLDEWLQRLEKAHGGKIDLGLERVGWVYQRLQLAPVAPVVITVAGTNGKGSTVAMLDAICRQAGYHSGCFTSPHLIRYNERFSVDGQPVTDEAILEAFDAIEKARGEISLSYFEFSTLAALWLFKQAAVDVAILEVGLGGRLDSVNVVDTDCAVITTVDIDHEHWLGNTREAVGREKAGIFRPGKPAICGDPDCPLSVRRTACQQRARLFCRDKEFTVCQREGNPSSGFDWLGWTRDLPNLPQPALRGHWQLQNAATAIAALESLAGRLDISPSDYAAGLRSVSLAGRLQRLQAAPEVLVDVAHNAQSATALASWLQHNPCSGRTVALFGALADKHAETWLPQFRFLVDAWVATAPQSERALSAPECQQLIEINLGGPVLFAEKDPLQAYEKALATLDKNDRLLVFGSFFVLDPILAAKLAPA